jgi:S1-C subfamily serine protease
VAPGGASPYWLPPHNDWKLGVYAYNTETGVVITRVVPRSAAAQAGLEPGDKVVNVAGFQVGYVGDRLYPLGHELQRQAGPNGRVGLLVQNVRNRDLLTLDVRLDRRGDMR